jgi:pyroglutamyl-peptidase
MTHQVRFTGFEPFGEHEFNPSAVVAEEAARAAGATFELLTVTFDAARKAGEASRDYDLVVHVGLAAATPWIRLERFAHNLRMAADDPGQERDPDAVRALDEAAPLALATTVDIGKLRRALVADWDVRHSRDAGTYVCNATYFWTLRLVPSARAVFVHVPAWSAEESARFGAALGREIASAHSPSASR